MINNQTEKQKTEKLLRAPEVMARTGLPYSTLYSLVAQGLFPKPIKLYGRCVAWPEPDVQTWIDGVVTQGRGPKS